jgi:hypothetical protein
VIADTLRGIEIAKERDLSAQGLFRNLTGRFGLRGNVADQVGSGERYVLWKGLKQ